MDDNSSPKYGIDLGGPTIPTISTPSPPADQASASSSQTAPAPPPGTTPTPNRAKPKQKKVRFACERCRYRRVKCDGQIPACGNCSKAGAPCIDADSRDADKRLMRGTQEHAIARISWLEHVVRTHLPHVNIDDDPLAFGLVEHFGGLSGNVVGALEMPLQNPSMGHMGNVQQSMGSINGGTTMEGNQPDPARGTKRTLEAVNINSGLQDKSIDQDARSVALELGLLSLNSDSRQMHYLGSSSGTLFAPLFLAKKSGASPLSKSSDLSQDGPSGKDMQSAKPARPDAPMTLENQKAVEDLYEQLRKVGTSNANWGFSILRVINRFCRLERSVLSSWNDSSITCILTTLSCIGLRSIVL